MVQISTQSEVETLLLNIPKNLKLYVTSEQFSALAARACLQTKRDHYKNVTEITGADLLFLFLKRGDWHGAWLIT